VFLSYQIALHRIAVDCDVGGVGWVPACQAQDNTDLFRDKALPNAVDSRFIADAPWARLQEM